MTLYFAGKVKFYILLNNHPVLVSATPEATLHDLFIDLRENVDATEYLPSKVSWEACKFYRLKNPVPLGEDDTDDEDNGRLGHLPNEVMRGCLDEANWVIVHPIRTRVHRLAKNFSADHIYLVIKVRDREYCHFKALGVL